MVSDPPNRALLEKALASFEDAGEKDPRFAPHRAGVGETLHVLGRHGEGDASLARALELSAEARRMDRLSPELEKAVRKRLEESETK